MFQGFQVGQQYTVDIGDRKVITTFDGHNLVQTDVENVSGKFMSVSQLNLD